MRRGRPRRSRGGRRVLAAVVTAVIAAAMSWIAASQSHDMRFVALGSAAPASLRKAPEGDRREVTAALRHGVEQAAELGGSVEAAAMFANWRDPVIVTSPPGGGKRWMRMWSMSKAVVMVGLLRAEGWGEVPGNPLTPEVQKALEGAITRSENCRQRRVVLELQQAPGGGPAGARRAGQGRRGGRAPRIELPRIPGKPA